MEQGDHVILFASEGPANEENTYYVVGVYQGKYLVDGDKVERQIPKAEGSGFKDKIKNKEDLIDLIMKN
jgi:hypothetical protein